MHGLPHGWLKVSLHQANSCSHALMNLLARSTETTLGEGGSQWLVGLAAVTATWASTVKKGQGLQVGHGPHSLNTCDSNALVATGIERMLILMMLSSMMTRLPLLYTKMTLLLIQMKIMPFPAQTRTKRVSGLL